MDDNMRDQLADTAAVVGRPMESGADECATSLEGVYDQYARSLYRYALALTGSSDDAEDAVQEVFVRLAREAKTLRKMKNVKAYLFTATRNSAYSVLRSRRRRAELSESMLWNASVDTAAQSTDLSAESAELRKAFAELPLEQRETLVLKVYDGMTFREIAAVVGASLGTVASRYRYGLARLRQALEDNDE
jgi:RNA polymerase sigma-70 factor, ECF subfamily